VRATYRKGSGAGGNVAPDQLTTLLTRPLGLKSATNPQPATGGADREQREDARSNMPLTVLTLDRIVSLFDYEDFARAYIGIAKAQATWTWNGQERGIFLTVAGVDGAAVQPDSALYKNLLAAMQNAGDLHVPLRVQSYVGQLFTLKAKVKVADDFANDKVLAAVAQALQSAFSFAARAFGQGIVLSEVVAVMHKVAGVQAVDVETLRRNDGVGGDGLKNPLPAAAPQLGANGTVAPAELLLLDTATLVLEVMA
jgi:predicted phage baseplate assembly protein